MILSVFFYVFLICIEYKITFRAFILFSTVWQFHRSNQYCQQLRSMSISGKVLDMHYSIKIEAE